jgi:hypothetical protein
VRKKPISLTLSDANKNALLVSIHRAIEETVTITVNGLVSGNSNETISYPPNGGLTSAEEGALAELQLNELQISALRKVLADQAASVVFELFSVIDGVSDPNPAPEKWTEVLLVDKPTHYDGHLEFLHDDLYGTYWDWRSQRDDLGWKLDNLDSSTTPGLPD